MNSINNNNLTPSFRGFNYSNKTKKILESRGEWSDFEKIIPEITRKGRNTNINFEITTIPSLYVFPETTIRCEIKPKNNIKSNPITRALGLANKQYYGYGQYNINDNRATEKTFRDIYESALIDHRDNAKKAKETRKTIINNIKSFFLKTKNNV